MKNIFEFFISLIRYFYCSILSRKVDFFDYKKLVKFDYTPPKFFNSVFLYGNYKAIGHLQGKRFNFITDYLEHGVCFINTVESARLLGYVDRKCIKNIYTYGVFRHNLIKKYLKNKGLNKKIIEVGPYILGASHFYDLKKISLIKKKYGRILLVYPQHSIENNIVNYELSDIINEIHKREGYFDSIFVCLYWKDIIMYPKYVQKYESEGFVVVSNGHRSDPKFLSRQRDLIELSDMMMTNGLGTHIGYSICMGKPVYFYKQNIQINNNEGCEVVENKEYKEIEKLFYSLFCNFSFEITDEQRKIVDYYWGKNNIN